MVSSSMDLNQVRLSIKSESGEGVEGAPSVKEKDVFRTTRAIKSGSTGCSPTPNNGFCFRWKKETSLSVKTRTRKEKKNTPLGYFLKKEPSPPQVSAPKARGRRLLHGLSVAQKHAVGEGTVVDLDVISLPAGMLNHSGTREVHFEKIHVVEVAKVGAWKRVGGRGRVSVVNTRFLPPKQEDDVSSTAAVLGKSTKFGEGTVVDFVVSLPAGMLNHSG
ncbi:hypothetical protein CEXT_214651 [Caerostris extrusa]|uniref:Uncharacterized protein n=1 Tax=Caerostris extrusa TaxID=172846 RepID=A0AAV4PJC2_CAEEX|nr:hypothetical protein CEXT_214651 [Caerostris extrusa]